MFDSEQQPNLGLEQRLPHGDRWSQRAARVAVLTGLIVAFGCKSMGPRTVEVDRFDYNSAIAASANQQMLLNLVRLRYGESILMLDVGQVIAQYRREGTVQAGAEAGFKSSGGLPGENLLAAGGRVTWSETPTITYSPRTGAAFTRSLLTPIAPTMIFGLIQRDWPEELVLRRVVRSINGVAVRSPDTGEWNPEYGKMMRAISQVQASGACGLATQKIAGGLSEEGKPKTVTTFRFRTVETDAETAKAIKTLRKMWKLDDDIHDYTLVFGVIPDSPDEIAVLTSSVMEVVRDLSDFIDVPPEHVADGRTGPSREPPPDAEDRSPPIHVRVSKDRPSDAYVAVQKDGWWYYIAATDFKSKEMFSLISILLNLAEAGQQPSGPIVAIGAGG